MQPEFGFREHAHTADWELEVWAPDLPALLEQAARGMYTLAGMQLEGSETHHRNLQLESADAESLLVRFLAELLWLQEDANLGFDHFSIMVSSGYKLQADLIGSTIVKVDKEIKAVTYHNLMIQTTPQGLRTCIVFDV
jgi:SHS2 domain-containing protein